jgi:hypothetical protein
MKPKKSLIIIPALVSAVDIWILFLLSIIPVLEVCGFYIPKGKGKVNR